MTISPFKFRRAYNRFQAINAAECGDPLESFANRESFVFKWEGYKNSIPDLALAAMKPNTWSPKQIGTGTILSSVIQAIELPGNNLLQWEGRQGPDSRVHLSLLQAQEDREARRYFEEQFYQIYTQDQANRTTFEALVSRCGRRYELLGYLFFIAAPDRFLPLRTRSFDKAFAEMGVDLRTEGNCGWENYLSFLSTIREVRRCLHAEGIADATCVESAAGAPQSSAIPCPIRSLICPFNPTRAPDIIQTKHSNS